MLIINKLFFERRLKYAVDYRRTVMGGDFACCRLVFGEADGLPGLTVDRFGGILVTQVLSYGMEKIKDEIYRTLVDILINEGEEINGVFERNDVAIRELEGLEQNEDGLYKAEDVLGRLDEAIGEYDKLLEKYVAEPEEEELDEAA